MVALVKLVGIVMVAAGVVYLVKPAIMERVMHFWVRGKRAYLGGVLSILVGIIFLFAASRCTLPWVVFVMGVLSLIKGVLAFALGPKKIAPLAEKFAKGSVTTLRVMAIIALSLGVLLIYSA